ncbi:MAG: ATP-dependent Clp protease adaptor ClpS [Myxococcales bacterium]|nr:ATP-dependent Clp protease adaptor ClpS [Myxococcales bacterium]MCB9645337.1 ATP-dependent Clp protease adaptor ClpS [Deltaproteobacteria bacterium]
MSTKPSSGTETLSETRKATKKPPMYKVLFHNDDYTTMEFVVSVLITVFHHSEASAFRIMMHVHTNGVGVAGVFTKEVAETKVAQTIAAARKNEYPLEVTIEPVD